MLLTRIVEQLARTEGRGVLAGLIRLTGDFDAAEDALQDAYARALVVWARDGVPDKPAAWLNTVARRIAIDRFRRDRTADLPDDLEAPLPAQAPPDIEDDRLRLLFVCCHPALSEEARCTLALRALGGLTNDVPVARRIADHVALAVSHEQLAEAARQVAEAHTRAERLESRGAVARRGARVEDRSCPRRWPLDRVDGVLKKATQVSETETTVLLTGDLGTGKEVVARFIHRASARRGGPFVALNCAALPEQLLDVQPAGDDSRERARAQQLPPAKAAAAIRGLEADVW